MRAARDDIEFSVSTHDQHTAFISSYNNERRLLVLRIR